MPPLALAPNQPYGQPDIYGYGGDASSAYGGSGYGGSSYASGGYPYSEETYNRYLQGTADERTEAKRQFDTKYFLDKQTANRTYQLAMMGARTQQDQQQAQAEYQRAQTEIAKERLQFDRETQSQNFGLQQANLGYNLLDLGARYKQNPADYFLESDWDRGVAGQPQTSTFLSALQNNSRLPGFNARGQVAQSASLNDLSASLGGGAVGADGSGGDQQQRQSNYLAQVGNIAARGAQQLGGGSLESLTPTERSLFTAGLKNLGYDSDTFLTQYARSRFGQNTSGSRAA